MSDPHLLSHEELDGNPTVFSGMPVFCATGETLAASNAEESGVAQDKTAKIPTQNEAVEQADETPAREQFPEPEESPMQDAPDAPFDFDKAEKQLLTLQQEIRKLGIPVIILFEGWAAAGKGTMAGELLEGLDPRGYKVYVPESFPMDEDNYPAPHRYITRMPAQGQISLFIGSWYQSLCAAAVSNKHLRHMLSERLERANLMERVLMCDGALILKFFINIPRKEQKRRLNELSSKKATRNCVSKADWAQNEDYDLLQAQYNLMLASSNEGGAAWQVLRGESKQECKQQMYAAVTNALRAAIEERRAGLRLWDTPALPSHEPLPTAPIAPLYAFDPSQRVVGSYKQQLHTAQKKLRKLQYELHHRDIPMILAFEGWDAAGKGGSILRLRSSLDARGFSVVPISAPTAEEKAHHHLWRFWKALPEHGHITIFDRTWYGRVMVERIEGLCTQPQWRRAYEEINLFEQELARDGAIVRKFWLQISNEEQLKRFNARQSDPQKQWKITDEDWRNREKWSAYEQAVGEMLQKTNTSVAPWTVVEANNKQFARLKVLNTVIGAIEERLK